jgi:hypothetical protein
MIRRISIGPDAFKSMHYILGQSVLDKTWIISAIIEKNGIEIWIQKDGEQVRWKKFTESFPLAIEYNIDYSISSNEITA